MVEKSVKKEVASVIAEIDTAYQAFSDYNSMNADYPKFAKMAVNQFRVALRNPELTREDIELLLRQGMSSHKVRDPDACWQKFVASYMAKTSNANSNAQDTRNV